jgi:hypothetical protein
MNVWIWFFPMIFANFLVNTIVFDNLPYFSREKWNLFPFFFNILVISTLIEFIIVRAYPGSDAEVISTAFISCGTGFILFLCVNISKEYDRLNGRHPHYNSS